MRRTGVTDCFETPMMSSDLFPAQTHMFRELRWMWAPGTMWDQAAGLHLESLSLTHLTTPTHITLNNNQFPLTALRLHAWCCCVAWTPHLSLSLPSLRFPSSLCRQRWHFSSPSQKAPARKQVLIPPPAGILQLLDRVLSQVSNVDGKLVDQNKTNTLKYGFYRWKF